MASEQGRKRLKADSASDPPMRGSLPASEDHIRKVLESASNISAAEASLLLDACGRYIKEDPLLISAWQLLRDVVKLPELVGRRVAAALEQSLSDSLKLVASSSESETMHELCESTWECAAQNLGFRPKIPILVSMIKTSGSLVTLTLRELFRALEAENDRKAFEMLCGDVELLSKLLEFACKSQEGAIKQLAVDTLSLIIFERDTKDDIVHGCTGPRTIDDAKSKKKTNQNNWRAKAFWDAITKMLEDSAVAYESFSLMCSLHRKKSQSRNVVLWFEMLFNALKSNTDVAQFKVAVMTDLITFGLNCYAPTVEQDYLALSKFADDLVNSKALNGLNLTRAVSTLLTLDYRVVEPHFGPLVASEYCPGVDSKTEMALVILDSFLATRRIHHWLLFMMTAFDRKWIVNDDKDLHIQVEATIRMTQSFEKKLSSHQSTLVWNAFFDVGEDVLFKHEFLLCAFASFVSSIDLTNPPSAEVMEKVEWAYSKSVELLSQKPNDLSNSTVLSLVRVAATCLCIKRSNGPKHPAEEEEADIWDAMIGLFTKSIKGRKRGSHDKIMFQELLRFMLIFVSIGKADDEEAETISSVFDHVFDSDAMLARLLRSWSTRSVLYRLPVDTCSEFWRLIVSSKSAELSALLGRAFLYEMPCMSDGFIHFFESKPSTGALSIAIQFPWGFLNRSGIKRLIKAINIEDVDANTLGEFLLHVIIPCDPKLLKKFFVDQSDLVGLLKRIEHVAIRKLLVSAIVENTSSKHLANVLSLAESLLKDRELGLLAELISSFAERLKRTDEHDLIAEIGQELAKVCDKAQALTAKSDPSLRLRSRASQLGLHGALAEALCTSINMNGFPLGECLKFCADVGANESAMAFLSVCAGCLQLIRPLLDDESFIALTALIFAKDGVSDLKAEFVSQVSSSHLSILIDAVLSEAWNATNESLKLVCENFKSIFEARLRKASRGVLIKKSKALLAASCRLVERSSESGLDQQELALSVLINFFSSKLLRQAISADDFMLVLVAIASSKHLLRVRILQLVCESQPSLLIGSSSGAFVRAIAACEREIVFDSNADRPVLERSSCAMELARICASMKSNQNAFKHLAVGVLADHITLLYYRGLPHDTVKRPLDMLAFALLDLCSERELQQLHAILGGGAGGARREMLKRLAAEHKSSHVFKGKI